MLVFFRVIEGAETWRVFQEDYIKGDEIGELVACQHAYHVGCVDQWLRLKNWCPICKTAAAPPHSSSSS